MTSVTRYTLSAMTASRSRDSAPVLPEAARAIKFAEHASGPRSKTRRAAAGLTRPSRGHMPAMRRLSLVVSVVLLALCPATAGAAPKATCTGDPSAVHRLNLTVRGQSTYGLYTLPASTPRGLVVFGHGYSYNVDAWRAHMGRAATRDGLVAVTMNYRGLTNLPKDATGFERSRGWPVKAGSEDLVAAGQYFDRVCGGFDRRFLLGVSMGGNSTGMAAALKARTAAGKPLFDYWIGVEGVWNLTELATQARAAGATNPLAQQAYDDIVAENGGPLEQQPQNYAER